MGKKGLLADAWRSKDDAQLSEIERKDEPTQSGGAPCQARHRAENRPESSG